MAVATVVLTKCVSTLVGDVIIVFNLILRTSTSISTPLFHLLSGLHIYAVTDPLGDLDRSYNFSIV